MTEPAGDVRAPSAAREEPAIAVRGLRKSFGAKEAVAGINLDIAHGSLSGLVGPNGAGKTTSLSMMTGLLRPDIPPPIGRWRRVRTGLRGEPDQAGGGDHDAVAFGYALLPGDGLVEGDAAVGPG
jgi:energy-coupling factor transporter ATP-binding protein EcfA2